MKMKTQDLNKYDILIDDKDSVFIYLESMEEAECLKVRVLSTNGINVKSSYYFWHSIRLNLGKNNNEAECYNEYHTIKNKFPEYFL